MRIKSPLLGTPGPKGKMVINLAGGAGNGITARIGELGLTPDNSRHVQAVVAFVSQPGSILFVMRGVDDYPLRVEVYKPGNWFSLI